MTLVTAATDWGDVDMTSKELLKSIRQIHISVTDIDRAVRFYRDTLGMRFLFQVPEQRMAFFQRGDVRLCLGIPESPGFTSRSIHYYRVDFIDAAHRG